MEKPQKIPKVAKVCTIVVMKNRFKYLTDVPNVIVYYLYL